MKDRNGRWNFELVLMVFCFVLQPVTGQLFAALRRPSNHSSHDVVPRGQLIDDIEPSFSIISSILDSKRYNRQIAPRQNGQPVTVRVGVNIQTINSVDEKQREMHLNLFVRLAWYDHRLVFQATNDTDYVTAAGDVADKVWVPDIFFPNERHGIRHALMEENQGIRFYANGQIFVRARYTLVLACDMAFEYFPFDTQKCKLVFQSIKYTRPFMELKWMYADRDFVPIYVQLAKFDLVDTELEDNCISNEPSGDYNCLVLWFYFKRHILFHIVETYLPCTLIVCASWISFWLDARSAPARTALGITSLLTIFGHGNHVKDSLPPVSVLKAIDCWIMVCEFYVFATLVEFAIVNSMRNFETKPGGGRRRSKRVDRLSRWLFPISFSVFCVLYTIIFVVLSH